ncbi:uncharacterized protein LOC144434880 [Glandiceps talaboti]
MNLQEYHRLSESKAPWICRKCTIPQFSDSFFEEIILDPTETFNDPNIKPLSKLASSGISIAAYNINSLLCHLDNLRIALMDFPTDIICLSETKLDSSILDSEIKIEGYNLISRKDRNRRGGGVACYVKSSIPALDRSQDVPTGLELTLTEIRLASSKPLIVGSIYRPPGPVQIDWYNDVERTTSVWNKVNIDFFLLGDFNVDVVKNPDSAMLSHLGDIGLTQLIKEPTRVTSTSSSTIDLLFSSSTSINHSGVYPLSISDHYMIYCNYRAKPPKPKPGYIKARNFKTFNNRHFLDDLRKFPWLKLTCATSSNIAWNEFKNFFNSICDIHAPWRISKVRGYTTPWLTDDIRKQIYTRDYLKRKTRSTNNQNLYDQFRIQRNKQTKSLNY